MMLPRNHLTNRSEVEEGESTATGSPPNPSSQQTRRSPPLRDFEIREGSVGPDRYGLFFTFGGLPARFSSENDIHRDGCALRLLFLQEGQSESVALPEIDCRKLANLTRRSRVIKRDRQDNGDEVGGALIGTGEHGVEKRGRMDSNENGNPEDLENRCTNYYYRVDDFFPAERPEFEPSNLPPQRQKLTHHKSPGPRASSPLPVQAPRPPRSSSPYPLPSTSSRLALLPKSPVPSGSITAVQ